jgi:tRNA A37 threonylcarbamoyladenosine dehydratase
MTEGSPFARHPPLRGSVLVIGVGAVGGELADKLARRGISPLGLIDYKVLKQPNISRHSLGAQHRGQPKAEAQAAKIRLDFPFCDVAGANENFLKMPEAVQRQLVSMFDVVVAATDEPACKRRINEVCLRAGITAVYPAVWTGPGIREGDIGEILWVRPRLHTPCYLCFA